MCDLVYDPTPPPTHQKKKKRKKKKKKKGAVDDHVGSGENRCRAVDARKATHTYLNSKER